MLVGNNGISGQLTTYHIRGDTDNRLHKHGSPLLPKIMHYESTAYFKVGLD
jgi:hypothetical protein